MGNIESTVRDDITCAVSALIFSKLKKAGISRGSTFIKYNMIAKIIGCTEQNAHRLFGAGCTAGALMDYYRNPPVKIKPETDTLWRVQDEISYSYDSEYIYTIKNDTTTIVSSDQYGYYILDEDGIRSVNRDDATLTWASHLREFRERHKEDEDIS